MRRLLVLLLALSMVAAACGGSDDAESAGQTTTVATTEAPTTDDGGGALDGDISHEEATNDTLEVWQADLNTVGCWAGPIDGALGPQTEAAIREFQAARGLQVDGLLGPDTKAALQEAIVSGDVVCFSDGDGDDGEGALAGDGDDGEGASAGGESIADLVATDPRFSTLLAAVEAAGLTGTLADPDASFTVFAPTNEAFEAAADALGLTMDELLSNPGLADILLYHVLGEVVTRGDLYASGEEEIGAETLQGENLWIVISDGGGVIFRDAGGAMVIEADIQASNGVIHVIDGVLLPPSSQV